MKTYVLLCVVLTMLTTTHGIQQYLKFYSQPAQQGNSVTFIENIPDLSVADYFLKANGSYEVLGWWHCTSGKNYTGTSRINLGHLLTVVKDNISTTTFGLSCRHNGAPDTNTQAISLYSSNTFDFGGPEILITGPAYASVPFNSTGISTTGYSNWTLYTGSNFDGNATCYVSKSQVTESDALEVKNIKSVLRNCNGRIDTYLYSSNKLTIEQ